jgi:hypothetical protein
MGRLYLYNSNLEENSIEVVALIARYCSSSHHRDDKFDGFEFLTLLDDNSGLTYLENPRCFSNYGINEGILEHLSKDYFSSFSEGVEVADFYLDEDGYISYENRRANRTIRRFLLVEFNGRFLLTSVRSLEHATHWMKSDRERNETGLQWENYISLFKKGAIYN